MMLARGFWIRISARYALAIFWIRLRILAACFARFIAQSERFQWRVVCLRQRFHGTQICQALVEIPQCIQKACKPRRTAVHPIVWRFDCTIGIHNRSASKHIDGALELPDVNGVCKHRTVCQISELTQRGLATLSYAMSAVRRWGGAYRSGVCMRLSTEPDRSRLFIRRWLP